MQCSLLHQWCGKFVVDFVYVYYDYFFVGRMQYGSSHGHFVLGVGMTLVLGFNSSRLQILLHGVDGSAVCLGILWMLIACQAWLSGGTGDGGLSLCSVPRFFDFGY